MTHLATYRPLPSNIYPIFIFFILSVIYQRVFLLFLIFYRFLFPFPPFKHSHMSLPVLSNFLLSFFINCCYVYETLKKLNSINSTSVFGWEASFHSVPSPPPNPFSIFLVFFYFLLDHLLFILHIWNNFLFLSICLLTFHQLLFDISAIHIFLL